MASTNEGSAFTTEPEEAAQVERGTRTRDEQLTAIVRDGATLAEAGSHFGISRERVRQILRREGLAVSALPGRARDRMRWRHDRLRASAVSVEELWRTGSTRGEIAIELGLTLTAVSALLCERVPREERLARAAQVRGEARQLPEEVALAALGDAARILGRCPGGGSYDRLRSRGLIDGPSATAIGARFGWAAACKAVGLTPNPRSTSDRFGAQFYSEASLREALSRIARMLGRAPTLREYEAHRRAGEPSAATIRLRYRGWVAARRELLR